VSWDDVLLIYKAENQERGESDSMCKWALSVSDQRIQLPLLNEFKKLLKSLVFQKLKILIQETIMVVVIFK
jgi:hypothetical protein